MKIIKTDLCLKSELSKELNVEASLNHQK